MEKFICSDCGKEFEVDVSEIEKSKMVKCPHCDYKWLFVKVNDEIRKLDYNEVIAQGNPI